MACELPSNYVAARTWNPERNSATSVGARVWAPISAGASCDTVALSDTTLRAFNGLFLYTFDGDPIQIF